ncbi:MAG: hypothetical protein OEZ06_31730 [Myxococcales bacterium]|nr:hypothetical protein [Myxococcales bacterium]
MDERERLAIADGFEADGWLSTIGQLVVDHPDTNNQSMFGHCTGTLIGPDVGGHHATHVLTAAHCATEQMQALAQYFVPRRNGAALLSVDYNVEQPGAPFGYFKSSMNVPSAALPPEYMSLGCDAPGGYDERCLIHDWAVLSYDMTPPPASSGPLPDGLATSTRWFMLLNAFSAAELETGKTWKLRGYPACGDLNSPAPCQSDYLYGNTKAACNIVPATGVSTGILDPMILPTDRVLASIDCDVSPGHSGGPMYDYFSGRPTIAGVVIAHCDEHPENVYCTLGQHLPNWMRRVESGMLNTIYSAFPILDQ